MRVSLMLQKLLNYPSEACFSIYSAVLAELCYVRAIDLAVSKQKQNNYMDLMNFTWMIFMCSLV